MPESRCDYLDILEELPLVDDQPKAKRILHKLYLSVLVPLLVVGVPLFLVGVVQVVHDRIVVGEDIQCVKDTLGPWSDFAKRERYYELKEDLGFISDAEMKKYEQEKKLKIEEILKNRENCNVSRESHGYVYKRAWISKSEMDYKDFYHEHIFLMSIPLFLAGILFAIRKWAIWLAK